MPMIDGEAAVTFAVKHSLVEQIISAMREEMNQGKEDHTRLSN